jgi:hypothetical protein
MLDFFSPKKHSTFSRTELAISNFERLTKGTEVLDEVVITSKVKEFENKVTGVATSLRRIDARKVIEPSQDLLRYIGNLKLQYRQSMRPLRGLFLNGYQVTNQTWLLEGISMNEVREFALGVPPIGTSRELHIFTYSFTEFNKISVESVDIKLPVGFAAEKEYYEPKYPTFSNQTFKYFGALYWKPNIVVEPNSSFTIKTPLHYQKGIYTFVEGINEDGKLFTNRL